MSKYHIQKNKPEPSDEEINKYKNFDKVIKKAGIYQYKQATRPLYKNVKLLSAVAMIIALGLIILFEHDSNYEIKQKESMHTDTMKHSTDTIHKPGKQLE